MTAKRREVNRGEAQLAYHAAAVALNRRIDVNALRRLAEKTMDIQDLTAAVNAMRLASDGAEIEHIVAAADIVLDGRGRL